MFELLASKDQALLARMDALSRQHEHEVVTERKKYLLVLDLRLHDVDGVGGLDVKGHGPSG